MIASATAWDRESTRGTMPERAPDDATPQLLDLPSDRGPVHCAYHKQAGGEAAVIMVGGGDGGLDGPAHALYPDLAEDLRTHGIGALRLDFRIHQFPGDVDESVHDMRVGIAFLTAQGYGRVGLLGHSFGGAVVIEAGAQEMAVTAVATLSTQTAGAQRVGELAPRPIFLIHGLADTRLSPDCSRMLYEQAGEPKRIELLDEATHSLRQRREDVRRLLIGWFAETLG